jgi:membrane-associated HD superfamily phosphohydrolase
MHRLHRLLDWISPNQILITHDNILTLFSAYIQFFKFWLELIQAKFMIKLFDIMLVVSEQTNSISWIFFTPAYCSLLILTILFKIWQFHSVTLAWIYWGQMAKCANALKFAHFRIRMHRFHRLVDRISWK